MMKTNKQSISQIVFEFLSIVFAVLLALGLNSYKQNLDLKSESKVLTEKLIRECRFNQNKLDSVIIRNQEFKTYLDSLRSLKENAGFGFNFSNELLSSSAWKFTQASSSYQFMSSEFLDDATELYEIQAYYMQISNQIFQNLGDMLMQVENVEPKTMIMASHYYLTNILNTANQLQTTYRDFLSKYDGEDVVID